MRNGIPDLRAVAADVGVHLNDDQMEHINALAKELGTHSDWRMWVKQRLANMGFLNAGKKGCDEVEVYTVLHVFNINRADVLPSTGMFLFSPEVARSKIIIGVVVPNPIDRTCWMVANDKDRKRIEGIRELCALD